MSFVPPTPTEYHVLSFAGWRWFSTLYLCGVICGEFRAWEKSPLCKQIRLFSRFVSGQASESQESFKESKTANLITFTLRPRESTHFAHLVHFDGLF